MLRDPDAAHAWEAWAVTIRTMAREQEWIADFNEWDTWMRAFFTWYNAATKGKHVYSAEVIRRNKLARGEE